MNFFPHLSSFFIIIFFGMSINGFSQFSDCTTMLPLKDTIYEAINIEGFGDELEYFNNKLEDSLKIEIERNSIWYLITAPSTGIFSFDITTEDEGNDWDFLLYEHKNLFCKRIVKDKIDPIRSNLSRSATTGLSTKSEEIYVGAGVKNNYSKALNVAVGDRFVLVVNNSKKAKGSHTLLLHFEKSIAAVIEEKQIKNEQLSFELKIKDGESNQLITSNISIDGLFRKKIEENQITTYHTILEKGKYKFTIHVNAKGYLLQTKDVNISDNRNLLNLDVFLEPIEKGKKINLKNIQFLGNVSKFLPESTPDLEALLAFMLLNSSVSIEIEGHVNGPSQRNTKEYQQLSESRAKAVKEYLETNGIDKNRIKAIGYGNKKMLFKNPISEYQMSENRRVEVKISQL